MNQSLGVTTFGQRNIHNPNIPAIASANVIAASRHVTRLTGNTTVKTLTVNDPYFNGPVYILNTDASVGTWDTTDNIALAGTFTRYKLFIFMYDPSAKKWYPSATS